jgi:hypothetical protein
MSTEPVQLVDEMNLLIVPAVVGEGTRRRREAYVHALATTT